MCAVGCMVQPSGLALGGLTARRQTQVSALIKKVIVLW
jgi:hypothetical protein